MPFPTTPPLNIGIDLRPLLSNRISGVETYIHNLLTALFDQDTHNHYYLWQNSAHPFTLPATFRRPNTTFLSTRIPNKLLNLTTQTLRSPSYEFFFPTILDVFFLPDPRPVNFTSTPLVTTFHDLSFELFPHFFSRRTRLWFRLLRPRLLASRSTHLITPSTYTRTTLTRLYSTPTQKITVIPEAPAPHLAPASPQEITRIRQKYSLPEKYILTLSTLEPRKNLPRLLLAFRTLHSLIKFPHTLVLAGTSNPRLFRTVPNLRSDSHILFPGFIPESDKAALYSGAEFFVYPSLLEGFGLPVIESLACGTPCLISNTSSLPEVAGPAGLPIDPTRISSLTTGLRTLLTNPTLLQSLRSATLPQARRFSWSLAASQTLTTLKKAARSPRHSSPLTSLVAESSHESDSSSAPATSASKPAAQSPNSKKF